MNLINQSDRVYIAGHNGMVGSSILRTIKKKGYKNIITANKQDLDLKCKSSVENFFKKNKPDVVIVAAAKVGGILANSKLPTEFLVENLRIELNTILSAWENKVKRLLFLGSSCIYPKYAQQPLREEYLLSGHLEPTNESYAIAKIAGLQLCKSLWQQYDFDAISLMPTNLYGPGDNFDINNSHVLPALIRKFYDAKMKDSKEVKCWGSGLPKREFLHVDDLAEACIFALEKWNPKKSSSPKLKTNEPLLFLNVGTGIDLQIKELAELIAYKIGYKGNILWDKSKPDGTPKKQLDITNIKKIGWYPKIDLVEGIEDTISYYKKNIITSKI